MLAATFLFILVAIFFIVILIIPNVKLAKLEIIVAVLMIIICIIGSIYCYRDYKHKIQTQAIESYIDGGYNIVIEGNSYYYEIYPVDND